MSSEERKSVHIVELVPILDAMTAVIFFLVLTASFVEYTKQTLPSSTVQTITDPMTPPPVAAKLYARKENNVFRLTLDWAGNAPDKIVDDNPIAMGDVHQMRVRAEAISKKFKDKYPQEKTIQLGLTATSTYQDMIAMMDGLKKNFQDIVLISYSDEKLGTALTVGK